MYSIGSLKVKNLTFFWGRIKKFGAVFWNNDLSWVIILMCITLLNKVLMDTPYSLWVMNLYSVLDSCSDVNMI